MHRHLLTRQQVHIISSPPSTMAVFAAPGSGKTTVLTEHLAHLIQSKCIRPKQTLAMTFTRKAATELKTRLQRIDGISHSAAESMRIGTFHAQMFAFLLAHNPGIPRIMDATEQARLLTTAMAAEGVAPTSTNVRWLLQLMSKHIDDGQSPLGRRGVRIIKRYRRHKTRVKLWDFDDILMETKCLLEQYAVSEVLASPPNYLLVDEFQDTNHLQFWILRRWIADTNGNLFVVGDDDQSIYGFRGATPKYLTHFTDAFPQAKETELSINFRSTKHLLEPAWDLIRVNQDRRNKQFAAARPGGRAVSIKFCQSDGHEAEQLIHELSLRFSVRPQANVAVLARTRRQLRELARWVRLVTADVTVSTFHEAKGREWDTVFILDAVMPNPFLPQQLGDPTIQAIEEERRLFYVAMTRAREELVIYVPEVLYSMKVQPLTYLHEAGLMKP